jgi:mutator protein MutT
LIAVVHVVAAAIIDGRGRVLIAQRPPGKHLAGGWEFPGGKLEPGEQRTQGLARELHEELGIAIRRPRPLIRVRHAYPTREILLDLWIVKSYTGEPQSLDGQALRWCPEEDLPSAQLLPADEPIVRALRLPERLLLIDTPDYRVDDLAIFLAKRRNKPAKGGLQMQGALCIGPADAGVAVAAGADFLVMGDRLAGEEVRALCETVTVPVFVRGLSLEEAWAMGATGISDSLP